MREKVARRPPDKRCAEDCAYLEKVGRFSAYGEGNARYFSSGGQFFDAVIEEPDATVIITNLA